MCGIAGIVYNHPLPENNDTALKRAQQVLRMEEALAHRGPDGRGSWANSTSTVLLGHRRLSIIDLSAAAAQPMHYANRFTITYNGEIYNYLELRAQLQQAGYRFSTRSDTEVILAAFACYGKDCVRYLDGMFAFAIWDEQEQSLFAARDRLGEKPFYYHQSGDTFFFASEMKALWAAGLQKNPDYGRWLAYLGLGNLQNDTDASATFYTGIFQLPPASYLTCQNNKITIQPYWWLGKTELDNISMQEATERFRYLLTKSVSLRLRSDVAVGASLSGGLDSSSIVALMVSQSKKEKPVTFSLVFPGFVKDETPFINEVTTAFGLVNHTTTPHEEDFINDLQQLCYYQEEPFQSGSIYGQYKVYQLARQHQVKVLLDGQGADETLAGYPHYHAWYWQELIARWKWKLWTAERKHVAEKAGNVTWGWKNYLAACFPALTQAQLQNRDTKKILHNVDIHPDFKVAHQSRSGIHQRNVIHGLNDLLHYNTTQFGLSELLRYADRNSMAHGVEVRLPFISHELLEFVFSLPAQYKIHQGFTKWILRQTMSNYLPSSIVWRTDKIGFEPPQKKWMQHTAIRDYLFECKKKLVNDKILNPAALTNDGTPLDAHAPDNYSWRYLMAGSFL